MKDSSEQTTDSSPENSSEEGSAMTYVTRGIILDPQPVPSPDEGPVKTTIVGGRPPAPGRQQGDIPRGIEVLLKKASVDPAFGQLVLEKRAEAAYEIGLELTAAEASALNAVPSAQLEQIIANTVVPANQRRAFLGGMGAAMLATLRSGCRAVRRRRPHRPESSGQLEQRKS